MGRPDLILRQKIATYSTINDFFVTFWRAVLEIAGYTAAVFLAETLVKIWAHQ